MQSHAGFPNVTLQLYTKALLISGPVRSGPAAFVRHEITPARIPFTATVWARKGPWKVPWLTAPVHRD